MKPGPAISTEVIRSSLRSFSAILSASSRGLALASLASTIAALVAMSPWPASRGGSTTTREKSIPAGQPPSAARPAQTAWTRAKTAANRCWAGALSADFSAIRRRLTQIRGRVKKPLMLDQGVAIGHPGDEIADPAGALGLGFLGRGIQPFRRKVAGRFSVALEQVDHDLLGLAHHPHHAAVPVHVLVEERLDPGFGLRDIRRKGDHGLLLAPHVLRRLRLRGRDAVAR